MEQPGHQRSTYLMLNDGFESEKLEKEAIVSRSARFVPRSLLPLVSTGVENPKRSVRSSVCDAVEQHNVKVHKHDKCFNSES